MSRSIRSSESSSSFSFWKHKEEEKRLSSVSSNSKENESILFFIHQLHFFFPSSLSNEPSRVATRSDIPRNEKQYSHQMHFTFSIISSINENTFLRRMCWSFDHFDRLHSQCTNITRTDRKRIYHEKKKIERTRLSDVA